MSSSRSGQAVICDSLAACERGWRAGCVEATTGDDATSRRCRWRLAFAPVIAVHMLATPATAKMTKMGTIMRRSIVKWTGERDDCHAAAVGATVCSVSKGTTPIANRAAPLPLLVIFGLFLAAIAYLVGASLTRRTAPVYSISPRERERSAHWQTVGDTLTIDATDGDKWQYVSLARGQVLTPPDTSGWEIAVQRYRMITAPGGRIADLGRVDFDQASSMPLAIFVPTTFAKEASNAAIGHWYRYNLLTHLLEPNGHLFVVRSGGATWKLAVVSYYCPRLVAGCLTIRYAPLGRVVIP